MLATAATEASTHEFSALDSVSCSSSTSCVAVGDFRDTGNHNEGLAEVLSGTTWTDMAVPAPSDLSTSNPFSQLYNVSCASSSFCVAGGEYNDTGGLTNGQLATWNGTTWTSASTPLPSSQRGHR